MVELVFVTSSNEKLAHARYLCKGYDVHISKQKQYGVGYKEPRITDRNELIKLSIEDAYERWKKNVTNAEDKLFFIEDTSVVIPTLSKDGMEYPGTDIKYWMQENDFNSVDTQLKKMGNDRRAIVRSVVALVLSKLLREVSGTRYLIFESSTKGAIVGKELPVETQPFYSWLSSKTFNKWFVPDGCDKPMSLLPIEIADRHDFRAGSFTQMLHFLQRHGVIKERSGDSNLPRQTAFFGPPLFIVTGPTCAGKTTIALYLSNQYGYYHLEASDFMYVRYYENHGITSHVPIADFAEKALLDNPCIVADQLIEHTGETDKNPLVITGFRSIDEIECFRKKYQGRFDIEEVFVDADQITRYERSRLRRRGDTSKTLEQFAKGDIQQDSMGLRLLRQEFSDGTVLNNETFDGFYQAFEDKFGELLKGQEITSRKTKSTLSLRLEDLIILALGKRFDSGEYFTTTEIAHLITKLSPDYTKNKNNVSRYFNYQFHPYFDISVSGEKRKYRLSQTGLSRSKWLENRMTD